MDFTVHPQGNLDFDGKHIGNMQFWLKPATN